MDTFSQILELDEDDESHVFSKSIVQNYFEQFDGTYKEMREALEKADLPKLSALGHFLKGSSAALGVWKVQGTCETIQHVGNLREEGAPPVTLKPDEAIKKMKVLYATVDGEFKEAKAWFLEYFPDGVGEAEA